ncbi:hypothetical protein [Nitrosomonas aestuarii]|uniref:hypothetical protein n=1 Tax=Nitrosomonas aestuarii TaxID=52441 RepID=UPI000D30AD40|nr:hypothetical protein [Nitrosomonas aestuarii]PTN12497.1 hypothetical protein C8R11_10365 [Nitrosomonas aestuarii]
MVKPTDESLRVSGGLTNIFIHCDACLSDAEFNRLRGHELAEIETKILHGQLSDSVSGVMERGSVVSNNESKQDQERKTKERRTAQLVELVERIRADMEQMKARIKALEDSFQQRDGDAWREKLALEILGADDIPQQESGENIEAYRKRLEKHLIEEMLNPDGSIKGKYQNDPQYSDYAEWAQKQYHLSNAKAVVAELDNDSTSPQRREQILHEMKERGYAEEMMLAARTTTDQNTQHEIKNADDSNQDIVAQNEQVSEVNAFLKL